MSAAYFRRITAGAGHFRQPTFATPPPQIHHLLFSSAPPEQRQLISLRSRNRYPRLIEAVPVGPRKAVQSQNIDDKANEINKAAEVTTAEVAAAAAVTVALGVGNRVLYKLALVPLKRYPFFLAQLATFGVKDRTNGMSCQHGTTTKSKRRHNKGN